MYDNNNHTRLWCTYNDLTQCLLMREVHLMSEPRIVNIMEFLDRSSRVINLKIRLRMTALQFGILHHQLMTIQQRIENNAFFSMSISLSDYFPAILLHAFRPHFHLSLLLCFLTFTHPSIHASLLSLRSPSFNMVTPSTPSNLSNSYLHLSVSPI